MSKRVERTYRGISTRLARRYLEILGGEVDDDTITGDGWRATISESTVSVGPTLQLTELAIAFEGEADTVDRIVTSFTKKAMRAGG